MQGFRGHDLNVGAKQILKIEEQLAKVSQAATGLDVDEYVDIAGWSGFTPSDRAEYSDVVRSALLGQAQDFFALGGA